MSDFCSCKVTKTTTQVHIGSDSTLAQTAAVGVGEGEGGNWCFLLASTSPGSPAFWESPTMS